MRDIIFYFVCKYLGNWGEIFEAIKRKETVDKIELERFKALNHYDYITIFDDDYPYSLKQIFNPPFLLFYKGDKSLLKDKKLIAVIGSRKPNEYGIKVTKDIVSKLASENFIVVSGLAKGIDAVAHQTCIDNNSKTIGVIAGGLNTTYPPSNKELYTKVNLIISEYPEGVEVTQDNFPVRNRIIAGLVSSILLTQAFPKSGSLITIRYGLEFGKNIYCVPHNIDDECICNSLIKNGATQVESARDIIEEFQENITE